MDFAERQFSGLLAASGCADVGCLLALNSSALLDAALALPNVTEPCATAWCPTVDGVEEDEPLGRRQRGRLLGDPPVPAKPRWSEATGEEPWASLDVRLLL